MAVFLITDIEGSTQKWEQNPEVMKSTLVRHDEIIKTQIAKNGGQIIKHTGDGIFAVFDAGQPLACALQIQRDLQAENWGVIGELRVRVGLHAGAVEKSGEDYFGPVVNRTARVMSVAWGGQIILTPDVRQSAKLPEGAAFVDLGVHLLKDLTEPQQIYGLVHPNLKLRDFPPLRSLSSRPHNLPIQATPFMGREKELVDIIKLLENPGCRLLTLIGPGGIGKTRLALQAAAERIENFEHGVFHISLAPLSSADFLIAAIASALKFNFYSRQEEKEQLLNFLREKEMLLVMDNFEHMVQGASLVAEILNNAPRIKILVTSRELLNLKGEWIIQVEGMKVPAGNDIINIEGYSAVQLFLYNAQRVNARVALTDEDKKYVVRICQLVAGMPLGIELASAWLRTLSSREICQEIEKNLDFLVTSMRDVPERHRSLRAVFDYSWNLLTGPEKEALKKLSVFRGAFTRDAADRIAGATLAVLAALVDKSLLRKSATGHYEMVDILRPYALEKMGASPSERETLETRFIEYYTAFLKAREKDIEFNRLTAVMDELNQEVENIRTALNMALTRGKPAEIDAFISGFATYCQNRGLLSEGAKTFEKATQVLTRVALTAEGRAPFGRTQLRWAMFLYQLGSIDRARVLLNESRAVFQELGLTSELADALNTLGNIDNLLCNYAAAQRTYEESMKLYREVGNKKGLMGSLNNLGVIAYRRDQFDVARKLFEESLVIGREIGFEKGISNALGNRALIDHELGNYQEAIKRTQESLEIDKKLGDKVGIANTTHNLGYTFRDLGELDRAQKYYEESLAIRREIGDRFGIAVSLNNLGTLATSSKRYEDAIKLLEESIAIYRALGDKGNLFMPLGNLGNVYLHTGKYDRAEKYYFETLDLTREQEMICHQLDAIMNFAELDHSRGLNELSFELLEFLRQHPDSDADLKKRVAEMIAKVTPTLKPEAITRVKDHLKNLDLKGIYLKIKASVREK